ncbi:MAG: AMP-binding protein [Nitriliruptorales bacterium]|nr:AMP-binding protein [Nitriliruptorales bacterium]
MRPRVPSQRVTNRSRGNDSTADRPGPPTSSCSSMIVSVRAPSKRPVPKVRRSSAVMPSRLSLPTTSTLSRRGPTSSRIDSAACARPLTRPATVVRSIFARPQCTAPAAVATPTRTATTNPARSRSRGRRRRREGRAAGRGGCLLVIGSGARQQQDRGSRLQQNGNDHRGSSSRWSQGYAMTQEGQPAAATRRPLGALLAHQVRVQGHRPLMTYYGPTSGERTELSFATFDNWASKTANLLVEELRLERGARVALMLHDHWTAAVVLAGAWKVGARVLVASTVDIDRAADVLFVSETAVPAGAGDHPGLVVIGAGIGGRVAGDPPGIAYGDDVLAFADDYDDPDVQADDVALERDGTVHTHADLAPAPVLGATDRLLVTATLRDSVEVVTAPVVSGASVVWCPTTDAALAAARAADERCTHVLDHGTTRPL